MPEAVENCVQSCLDNPDFKPKDPDQTKKEACWALCTWLDGQGKLTDSEVPNFMDLANEALASLDIEKQGWPYCVCPECGYTEDKQAGVACRTIKCPECGTPLMGSQSEGTVAESVMKRSDKVQTPHAFRVVLPVTRAEKRIKRSAGEDLTEYWLHIEASGPERDSHGTRMSPACLARFVAYAEDGIDGEPLPYLDGHYQDLLAAMLGDVRNPSLTEEKHFAVDVLLDRDNPHSMRLHRDVERGKRHGASIAGIVHDFSIEKYQDEDGNDVIEEVFDDIELVEISRTTWPSWQSSFTEMIGKHMHPADAGELTELRARRSMIADARPTLARILEAHDVDENFEVSDGPWAEVADLTHRHQYAIVRRHPDGAFSPGRSGYVHHTSNGSISREGLCLAVNALSADLTSDELPFRKVEMEHAAMHLARHVVNELGEPVPEGLQTLVKLDDIAEVAMAIQTDSAPDELLSQDSVQTEPAAEETEVVERVVEETEEIAEPETVEPEVTEPAETEPAETDEPVVTAPDVAGPVVVTPDIDLPSDMTERATTASDTAEDKAIETAEEVELEPESEIEPESTQMSELKIRLSDGLAVTAMSRLLFATQGLLAERVWQEEASAEERVALGSQILDEFNSMAKDMLPALATAPKEPDLLCEFIGRVELVEGVLSRRRADKVIEIAARLTNEATQLTQVLNNMDLLDDTGDVQGVSELRSEVREDLSEIRGQLQDAVDDTQKTEREQVADIIKRLEARANQPAQSRRVAAPPTEPKAQEEAEFDNAKDQFLGWTPKS